MTRLRNLLFFRPPRLTSNPNPPSGPVVPTGDQGTANALTGSAQTAAQELGGTPYAPVDAVSAFTASAYDWHTPSQGRLIALGPSYVIPEDGTITCEIMCRGGTSSAGIRTGAYLDNGNATVTQIGSFGPGNEAYNAGSRPGVPLGMHAEVTVNASASADWRGAGTPITVTSGQIIHFVVWVGNVANGVQMIRQNGGSTNNRYQPNNGVATYSSSGDPPNPYPSAGNTSDLVRYDFPHRFNFTPATLSAPANVTATASTDVRQITITWDAVPGAEFYRVSRGATVVGTVTGTSFTDVDLPSGDTYAYNISAIRKNRVGTAGTSNNATVTGVRIATATQTPTPIASTTAVWNAMRGLSGANTTLSGVIDYEDYARVGFHWGAFQTSDPNSYNWTVLDNFLSGLDSNKRAWIRFRCSVPGGGNLLPSFVTSGFRNTAGGAEYPNWNNAQVITWLHNWINALGTRYNNDDRIQFLDMGFYAQFGEWTGEQGSDPATPTNKRNLIDVITTAFSNKQIIMSAMDTYDSDDEETLWYTMNKSNVIGIRQDSLGRETTTYMAQQVYGLNRSLRMRNLMRSKRVYRACEHFAAYTDANTNNWRIVVADTYALRLAVIGGENAANMNSLTGTNRTNAFESLRVAGYRIRPTIIQYPTIIDRSNPNVLTVGWVNSGFGFVVDNRPVFVQLRQSGTVVWEQQLAIDLRTLYEGDPAVLTTDTLTGLSGVTPGTYDLCIEGKAIASGRVPAFNFDMTNTRSGGSYIIASVTVQ